MIKELKIILNKMCEMVGATDVYFKKDNWYNQYTWTEEQEAEFKEWLIDYLKDKEVRKVIMSMPIKQLRSKFADNFLMSYGWKYKPRK